MAKKIDHETANRLRRGKGGDAVRPGTVVAWWWTIGTGGLCSDCGEPMPRGTTVAYNHSQSRAVCEVCADRAGLAPQPSRKFLAMRARKK